MGTDVVNATQDELKSYLFRLFSMVTVYFECGDNILFKKSSTYLGCLLSCLSRVRSISFKYSVKVAPNLRLGQVGSKEGEVVGNIMGDLVDEEEDEEDKIDSVVTDAADKAVSNGGCFIAFDCCCIMLNCSVKSWERRSKSFSYNLYSFCK